MPNRSLDILWAEMQMPEAAASADTEIRAQFSVSSMDGLALPLTGLQYAIFAAPLPADWAAPALKGNDGAITEDREFVLDVTGTFDAEEIVAVVLSDMAATPGPTRGWVAVAEVSEVAS